MSTEECPVCHGSLDDETEACRRSRCRHCKTVIGRDPFGRLVASDRDETPSALRQLVQSEEFRREYAISKPLGVGGMGAVFGATKLSTGRAVAIKFLTCPSSPKLSARFLREARLLAQVSHPNVLRVIEVGNVGPFLYLVTDLLTGGSLRNILVKQGRLNVLTAAQISVDCLAGLQACHARGIIHRDVKPDNVFFDEKGQALLGDFGLAREVDQTQELTRPGDVLGTPRYIAPEQIENASVGPAADLYTMGLVLYEMLTGNHPFPRPDVPSMLRAHVHEIPRSPSSLVAGISPGLDSLVMSALAKRPDDRPRSAEAFAAALRAAVADPGRHTARRPVSAESPTTSAPAHPWRWACVITAMVAGVVLGRLAARTSPPVAPSADTSPPVLATGRSTMVALERRVAGELVPITESAEWSDRDPQDRIDRLAALRSAVELLCQASRQAASPRDAEHGALRYELLALVLARVGAVETARGGPREAQPAGTGDAVYFPHRIRTLAREVVPQRVVAPPAGNQAVQRLASSLEWLDTGRPPGDPRDAVTTALDRLRLVRVADLSSRTWGSIHRPATLARRLQLLAREAARHPDPTRPGQTLAGRIVDWLDSQDCVVAREAGAWELRSVMKLAGQTSSCSEVSLLRWIVAVLGRGEKRDHSDLDSLSVQRALSHSAPLLAQIDGADRERRAYAELARGSELDWTRPLDPSVTSALTSRMAQERSPLTAVTLLVLAELVAADLGRRARDTEGLSREYDLQWSLQQLLVTRVLSDLGVLAGPARPDRFLAEDRSRFVRLSLRTLGDLRNDRDGLMRQQATRIVLGGLPETIAQAWPALAPVGPAPNPGR